MGILDDGKIIISGYVRDSAYSYNHIAMCRLTSTGVLDYSFGVNGLKTYDFLDLWCFPDEMIIHNVLIDSISQAQKLGFEAVEAIETDSNEDLKNIMNQMINREF